MSNVCNRTDRRDETMTEHHRTSPKAGHDGRSVSSGAAGAVSGKDCAIRRGPFTEPTIDAHTMASRENQAEEDLLYLTGLVFGRAILEQRGAGDADLAWMTAEITKVRTRLADGQLTTVNLEAQPDHARHHPPQPSATGVTLWRVAS